MAVVTAPRGPSARGKKGCTCRPVGGFRQPESKFAQRTENLFTFFPAVHLSFLEATKSFGNSRFFAGASTFSREEIFGGADWSRTKRVHWPWILAAIVARVKQTEI
jgi:hypothetical protein